MKAHTSLYNIINLLDYNGTINGAAAEGNAEGARDDDEGWDMVTCFCGKPFAGRPMIECSGNFKLHHFSRSYVELGFSRPLVLPPC